MTPITPEGRRERMAQESEELQELCGQLRCEIASQQWYAVIDTCERIEEMANGIGSDTRRVNGIL